MFSIVPPPPWQTGLKLKLFLWGSPHSTQTLYSFSPCSVPNSRDVRDFSGIYRVCINGAQQAWGGFMCHALRNWLECWGTWTLIFFVSNKFLVLKDTCVSCCPSYKMLQEKHHLKSHIFILKNKILQCFTDCDLSSKHIMPFFRSLFSTLFSRLHSKFLACLSCS